MSRAIALAAALALAAPVAARADVDYFQAAKKPNAITVRQGKDRPPRTRLLLGGLGAGAALSLGVGVYFNLDAHDAAQQVSAHAPTGKVWSADLQATYDRVHAANVKAIVGYSVAGAFVAAAIVTLIMTDPGEEEVELDPTKPTPTVSIPPTGGAIVGATWSF
jgi:hypothetical protein